ncbi:hypothetical protein JVX96_20945 [Variovorax sp. PDNC026]|uniref:hypothetical protein n=1 Tax=Variovorax sp. PDNC026 TaxID=2811425 RepID=UPI00196239FB|nr:hypothetical protein [Variovorax sp. PDNC026]QRY30539.1 hypothetical protein JVX96_20945 [Variovorax sp. PDNC026]
MSFDVPPKKAGWVAPPRPTVLDLYSLPGPEVKLIHLLLGATDVVHSASGVKVPQRVNWAVLGTTPADRKKSGFKNALTSQTLGIDDLNAYLTRNLAQTGFFEELFDEFSRFFYHTKKSLHVQAFLHLYRILERVSYSFPIAYAATSHDYKGTFAQLRNYLTSAKDGELRFFNGFISHTIPAQARTSSVKFDVSSNDPSTRPFHFASLASTLRPTEIKNQSPGNWIEVDYDKVISIFIDLRNRYFHFGSGMPQNLTGKNLPDPDEFFGSINEIFANWLTYIYFRVIEARL